MIKKLIVLRTVLALAAIIPNCLLAQDYIDTLIMQTSEVLFGEVKGMDENVLTIETSYSDKDFKVEWDALKYIATTHKLVVMTHEGERLYGTIRSVGEQVATVMVNDKDVGAVQIPLSNVIFLKSVEDNFWGRIEFSVAAGYTAAKANDNHQFSADLGLKYVGAKYGSDLTFSAIRTIQTDNNVESRTKRTEAGLGLLYFFYNDWFAIARADLLQSSEQKLNIRSLIRGGVGNYIFKTNSMNIGLAGGIAWNYEDYTAADIADRNSAEAFIGFEYKIFDLGDLDLTTNAVAYPSLTESGRFRTDFNFDLDYEFESDLFVGIGFTLNFDNMPVEGAPRNDYVFQAKIGWKFN